MVSSDNVLRFADDVKPQQDDAKPQQQTTLPTAERSGPAILNLLQQAAEVARRNEDRAKAMAQRLADDLRGLERRNQELEAHLHHFRDRAERAEHWLMHIHNEIQNRLIEPRAAAAE